MSSRSPLVPPVVGTVRFSASKTAWLYAVALLGVAGLWHVTLASAVIASGIAFLTVCCGHSVGLHRGLIHRAFRMPRWLRDVLLLLFCQTGLGGPLSWIRLHHVRDHWQSRPDTPPYFGYRHSLLRDFVWNLHLGFEPVDPADWQQRYGVPAELEDDPFLRWLEATWRWQVVGAFALAWGIGGFGFATVVVAGRAAVTILLHWLIGFVSHTHGRVRFEIPGATEEGRDSWLLGVVAFGEGFHNTHHALPRSARMGIGPFDFDLGYLVVRGLEHLGLVADVVRPGDRRARKAGVRSRGRTTTRSHGLVARSRSRA